MAVWRNILQECEWLEESTMLEDFDREIQILNVERRMSSTEMLAVRFVLGLAVISTFFDQLKNHHQEAMIKRFARLGRTHRAPDRDRGALASCMFEVQVFGRLAAAGFDPVFIPENAYKKTPDIVVESHRVLIECKDLKPREVGAGTLNSICSALREHSLRAVDQFRAHDDTDLYHHALAVHLPPHSQGVLSKHGIQRWASVYDSAFGGIYSGATNRRRLLTGFLVESAFWPLYGRYWRGAGPNDHWHPTAPFFANSIAPFIWELFMSMQVCPYEGFAYPSYRAATCAQGVSKEVLERYPHRRARYYYDLHFRRRSPEVKRGWREIPPHPMLPSVEQLESCQIVKA